VYSSYAKYKRFEKYADFILKPLFALQVPVYRNANLAIKEMQPIVFSHGLTVNRMNYSALCMELASCGYLVVALTHNDGSADYSKIAGPYDQSEVYDYWGKNF
jgi:hypothetical protein